MATQAMFLVRRSAALALLGWSTACGAAGQLDPDGQGGMEREVARRAAVEPAVGADWHMTRSVEAGAQIAGEDNLFWKLSNTPARNPAFDFQPYWYEFYVKPALGFKRNLGDGRQLYARVSAVGSGTVRHDPFGRAIRAASRSRNSSPASACRSAMRARAWICRPVRRILRSVPACWSPMAARTVLTAAR